MDDIVERLRGFKSAAAQSWAHEAADEIESLRAQLAEVTTKREEESRQADYWAGAHGEMMEKRNAVEQQLLATQAHAARLVDALGQVMDDIRSEDYLFDGGNGISADTECMVSKTLSTPISLDALHEDRARTLEEAAKVAALSSEGAANAIRVMAEAYRALREVK